MPETSYDRPVKAKLFVHLDNGEMFEAGPDDLAKFRLVDRLDAYMALQRKLSAVLAGAGLLDYDNPVDGEYRELVDAELNPLRHLAEVVLVMPDLADNPDYDGWADVASLERRLRIAKPYDGSAEAGEEDLASPYDGKPLAEIIDDFALVRGDLSVGCAREQLAKAVLGSKEVRALVAKHVASHLTNATSGATA